MTEADVIQPSASTASTGKGIRYIGNHVYAYSGFQPASTAGNLVFEFTTGAGYIVGTFQFNAFIETQGDPTNGAIGSALIKFNGERVILLKTSGASETMPAFATSEVIIPPFTDIVVYLDASEITATEEASINLTGRVYGAT